MSKYLIIIYNDYITNKKIIMYIFKETKQHKYKHVYKYSLIYHSKLQEDTLSKEFIWTIISKYNKSLNLIETDDLKSTILLLKFNNININKDVLEVIDDEIFGPKI